MSSDYIFPPAIRVTTSCGEQIFFLIFQKKKINIPLASFRAGRKSEMSPKKDLFKKKEMKLLKCK